MKLAENIKQSNNYNRIVKSFKKYKHLSTVDPRNYDYSNAIYYNVDTKIEIMCKIHGTFFMSPDSHFNRRKSSCPKCGKQHMAEKRKMSLSDFVIKSNKVHSCKYLYNNTVYVKSGEKVEIICSTHGSFWQAPRDHLSGHGCSKCGDAKTSSYLSDTLDSFILKAKSIHNDRYTYLKTVYTKSRGMLTITCPHHGDFTQRASDHLNGNGCQVCGNNRKRAKYLQKPTILYYLYLPKYKVYKIGVTLKSRGVKQRYSYDKGLEYIILLEKVYNTGKEAYEKEQQILKDHKDSRYKGDKFFFDGGESECFITNVLNL